METQWLFGWANVQKGGILGKRELFNALLAERLSIRCEARIWRVLTRLTYQSLRKKYELRYEFTRDEKRMGSLLQELGLSPSTCFAWYYRTFEKHPLKLVKDECRDDQTGAICDCSLDEVVREQITQNYEYKLASKRLYQVIVKVELFKRALVRADIRLDDEEICKGLRRLVEEKYYKHQYKRRTMFHLRKCDLLVQKVLDKRNIGAMAVLKWFYLLLKHPELLRKAQHNLIAPDEMFKEAMDMMKEDIHKDIIPGGGF